LETKNLGIIKLCC